MFTYKINESKVLYNTSAKTVELILHKTGWSKLKTDTKCHQYSKACVKLQVVCMHHPAHHWY